MAGLVQFTMCAEGEGNFYSLGEIKKPPSAGAVLLQVEDEKAPRQKVVSRQEQASSTVVEEEMSRVVSRSRHHEHPTSAKLEAGFSLRPPELV